MEARLRTYLENDCSSLRHIKDLSTYQIGPYQKTLDRSANCVFCDSMHDNLKVWEYREASLTKILVIGVHCCRICDEEIDARILQMYGGHIDFEEIGVDLNTQHVKALRREKIKNFNSARIFFHDVDLYLSHISSEIIAGCVNNRCYFCDEFLKSTPANKLEVPVPNATYLSGGEIRVCDNCWAELQEIVVGEIRNSKHIGMDMCPKCSKLYLIESKELESRKEEGTSGLHLCGPCSYDVTIQNKNSLRVELNRFPTAAISRFRAEKCRKCEEEISLDTTLSDEELRKHLVGGIIYCPTCVALELTKANTNKLGVKIDDKWVVIVKVGKEWVFNIYKVRRFLAKRLCRGETGYGSPHEAASQAVEKVMQLKMRELW